MIGVFYSQWVSRTDHLASTVAGGGQQQSRRATRVGWMDGWVLSCCWLTALRLSFGSLLPWADPTPVIRLACVSKTPAAGDKHTCMLEQTSVARRKLGIFDCLALSRSCRPPRSLPNFSHLTSSPPLSHVPGARALYGVPGWPKEETIFCPSHQPPSKPDALCPGHHKTNTWNSEGSRTVDALHFLRNGMPTMYSRQVI